MYELVPYIEKKFRGIGAGLGALHCTAARPAAGRRWPCRSSIPDEFNGCYAACPDPIDFRAYTVVEHLQGRERVLRRRPVRKKCRARATATTSATSQATLEQTNRMELVLGTKTRSGQQWDIWEAVYSPVGPDGYPKRIWDKRTGDIDKKVAEYWKENYDLVHILAARLGKGLGQKLAGQDPPLRRRHGQLLPEQRRVSGRGLPEDARRPALRRRGRLRRPGRALLERRPDPPQRLSRACATTRCSCRRSSSGWRRPRRPGPTSRAGVTDAPRGASRDLLHAQAGRGRPTSEQVAVRDVLEQAAPPGPRLAQEPGSRDPGTACTSTREVTADLPRTGALGSVSGIECRLRMASP